MSLSLVESQPQSIPDAPPLEVGEALGPYVIERVLGEGSMGRVYLGRHQRLGRNVALKVLHDRLLRDRQLVDRLMLEGRLVNQINHRHIVEVHDFVEELMPERVYCVMEFLRGETLSHRLATRATSIEGIITIARQIASALGAAHAAGVVHRDLKPDNIFLVEREGRDDWVKVLDFGVAKSAPDQGEVNLVQSQQGVLLGTPRYMAPEQVAGLDVDARTDVYALGTILYEMLTGKVPFEASTFGQLAADIITQPPPPLPKLSTSQEPIPPSLAALVTACLAKKPADRPASMGAVDGALTGGAVIQPSSARPWKPIALAAAVLVALVAGGLALRPKESPTQLEVVPPPPPPVVLLDEVTLKITTQPEGARVTRGDTGEVLGVTPLDFKSARRTMPTPLRVELNGFEPLERAVVLDSNQRLEFTLKAIPAAVKPKPRRVVTDGVLDPY
ncbi:MAG: serine/threonine protein kinase [Archangium sp.]|nr:serine/threonine protein kinase [Archangium sp.]